MFQQGDIVRRKNDLSGRTRVVVEIYLGGHTVMLDEFLDGWLVWDCKDLQLVERAATEPTPRPARHIPAK